ncbi:MAG: MBL fold metallo-hydrolase [Anaerolineae bacterium]|nr:MBL fold metallo-hydrolase [Anaerolineae bacterium]MDW8172966.1 MBL fold metallo-hydrolase [Anaerolineae bacterium]
MLMKYFYDERLAQASYMVGCPGAGVALVIDPARDIRPYLQAAAQHGLKITHVAETHIHADFVSGARELAYATNAVQVLSAEGGAEWQYMRPVGDRVLLVREGDSFMIGAVKMEVMHTPGHTPEHVVYMVTDTAASRVPLGVFTGDFLFVGDVGRPDLLDKVVLHDGSAEGGARQQFRNVERFKALPDYLQIFPGHGAGSACGKALGAVPSTTLGYEKLVNPAFQFNDEDGFAAWLLSGQPEPPRYFAQMKKVNKRGAALLKELPVILNHAWMEADLPSRALVIDTRPLEDFAHGHVRGTINIPINETSFCTYLGWYVDYESPVYFIAYEQDVPTVITALRSIGVDNVRGVFSPSAVKDATGVIWQIAPNQAREAKLKLLDVRSLEEHRARRIDGATHIHMGDVLRHLDKLPRNETLVVHCGGGVRSQVVVSLLQRAGFSNVANMAGGIDAWQAAGLPVVEA